MSWHGIQGHDDVVELFRRALARGRLASSFLFAGPEGIGKRTFALKLAQALLCPGSRRRRWIPAKPAQAAPWSWPAPIPTSTWSASPPTRHFSPWNCSSATANTAARRDCATTSA